MEKGAGPQAYQQRAAAMQAAMERIVAGYGQRTQVQTRTGAEVVHDGRSDLRREYDRRAGSNGKG